MTDSITEVKLTIKKKVEGGNFDLFPNFKGVLNFISNLHTFPNSRSSSPSPEPPSPPPGNTQRAKKKCQVNRSSKFQSKTMVHRISKKQEKQRKKLTKWLIEQRNIGGKFRFSSKLPSLPFLPLKDPFWATILTMGPNLNLRPPPVCFLDFLIYALLNLSDA